MPWHYKSVHQIFPLQISISSGRLTKPLQGNQVGVFQVIPSGGIQGSHAHAHTNTAAAAAAVAAAAAAVAAAAAAAAAAAVLPI